MGGGTEKQLALEGRTYLILGATGNLGRPIMDLLLWQGANVVAVARNAAKLIQAKNKIGLPKSRVRFISFELSDRYNISPFILRNISRVDGIIYALGHCGPGGFSAEVQDSLISEPSALKVHRDYHLHVTLLHMCVTSLVDHLPAGCHFVVLGSAITDIPWDRIPPWLHAGHYAMATAAKEQFVNFLRLVPEIRERLILVHYIAPGAVDTPFHHGAPPELTPPCMLSTDEVATEVLYALLSDKPVHKLWRGRQK